MAFPVVKEAGHSCHQGSLGFLEESCMAAEEVVHSFQEESLGYLVVVVGEYCWV